MADSSGSWLTHAWRLLTGHHEHPTLETLIEHEATRLLVAGVGIGAAGGLAAGAFDWLLTAVSRGVLGIAEPSIAAPVWWRALFGPALCGVLAGAVILAFTSRRRPQSVPDVIERVRLDAPSLSVRDGLASALAAALVVGGGQSGGREGPIVQLSSALGARVCRLMRLPARHSRTLVAAGAAAGVAASFNTPVGGAFFALEIVLGDWGVASFAPVVAATVTGTVVGQALLGDRIALVLPSFKLASPLELPFYLVLGGLSGAVAVAFKRAVAFGSAWFGGLPLHPIARTGAAGLAVGVVAAAGFQPVMGNGYAWMERAITAPEQFGLPFLVLLLVVTAAATTATAEVAALAGRTLRELALPAHHGCVVVAHSVWDASEGRWHRRATDARRRPEAGDRLVVIGPADEVAALHGTA